MWNFVSKSNKSYGVQTIVIDTLAELKVLPVGTFRQGTTAFVIETQTSYMLSGNRTWVPFNLPTIVTGSSTGLSDGSSSDPLVWGDY